MVVFAQTAILNKGGGSATICLDKHPNKVVKTCVYPPQCGSFFRNEQGMLGDQLGIGAASAVQKQQ